MLQNFSGTWFFVADDDFSFTEYPLAYPSLFFNMIDGRVSKYWTNPAITEVDGHRTEFRAFKEWMSDPMFYERLVDWHKTENAIFREYKELMDIEFPNPIKYKPVSYIEDDWCQCVACEHVWENFQTDSGMLRCPKCRQVLIDPRWAEPIQQEILFI
jgi:hypothetical protein